MGRPREFDETNVLERAMQSFWARGYEATSLHDLLLVMGLSKSSFYETFGSKHELFLRSLEHYTATVVRDAGDVLKQEPSGRKAISYVFESILAEARGGGLQRGCMLGNSASELAPHDAEAADLVQKGLKRLDDAFRGAVQRGQKAGEISKKQDARALARFLHSNLIGLRLMAKAGVSQAALKDIMNVTLSTLDR